MGTRGAPGNTLVAFEDDLNSIVKEYLEFCTFNTTLKSFESETRDRGKPLKPLPKRPWDMKKKDLQFNLLSLFKTGSRKEFFQLWDENIPESVKSNDPVCKKLEFYLSIYFAIYPIKYQLSTGKKSKIKVEDSMLAFKTFLESRGAVLSQTTEFLPFYALPFVPDPTKHPSYKELFQDSWVPDLQLRLEKFLMLTLPAHPQPRLFEIYQDLNNKNAEQMNQLQQSVVEAEKRCMTYIKRYNKLQSDYHNLIGITAELVDSLESCINGDPVTPEYLQTVCQRLFSNQLRESVDINRPSTAGEMFRASFAPPSPILEERSKEEVPLLPSLDYDKVKQDMINAASRKRELLLQALRWRLTRSEPGEQRDTVLAAYIQHDLLGCAEDDEHRYAVMDLLSSGEEVAQQYMARLFNAFASLSTGRNYLGKNEEIVTVLQLALQSEEKDPITRENVLGALQKLSLKRHLQTSMINAGIISWLVGVLEDSDSLSDYTLEYSVALLMNLCLRTAGKKNCVNDRAKMLKVLSDLLGHEDQEIRPYVNGTLYSILSVPEIREEAKAMGMEETLKCFIKDDTPEMNRQIHFIIKQLNTDVISEDVESDDEEEEEDGEEDQDQDAMEADLDKAEAIKAKPGELAGEKLLSTEYLGMLTNAQFLSLSQDKGSAMNEKPFSRLETERRSAPTSVQRSAASVRHSAVDGTDGPQDISSPAKEPNGQTVRPPTRCGSRSSQQSQAAAAAAAGDSNDKGLSDVDADGGRASSKQTADKKPERNPSSKSVGSVNGRSKAQSEYEHAFASRPKIPRDSISAKGRPSSRGMTPPPAPKASGSPPMTRPNTGGSRQTKKGSRLDVRNASLPPVENVELDYQAMNRPSSTLSVLSAMSSVSLHFGSGTSDRPSREPSGLASVKSDRSVFSPGSSKEDNQ